MVFTLLWKGKNSIFFPLSRCCFFFFFPEAGKSLGLTGQINYQTLLGNPLFASVNLQGFSQISIKILLWIDGILGGSSCLSPPRSPLFILLSCFLSVPYLEQPRGEFWVGFQQQQISQDTRNSQIHLLGRSSSIPLGDTSRSPTYPHWNLRAAAINRTDFNWRLQFH